MVEAMVQEEEMIFVSCGICGYCDDYDIADIQNAEAYCENCGNDIE